MSGGKPTYVQISKATGISISTISRVMNNNPNVSEATREKVLKAMEESGMDTSSVQLLPETNYKLILFNVPSMRNIFYSPIITSAKRAAANYGYSMVVDENPLADIDSFLPVLRHSQVAGVISTSPIQEESRRKITAVCPLVLCCEGGLGIEDVPYVAVNNESAALGAVRYLLSLGRRKVAMLNGPGNYIYSRDRFSGYRKALEEAGLSLDMELVASVGADMDFDMAKAAALRMLNSPERPDAFFCISDVLASAVIRACHELGLGVPGDVAVVGFDDLILAPAMNPSITTVRQPCAQLGALAAEMLIRLLRGDKPVNSMLLGTELIIRESTTL